MQFSFSYTGCYIKDEEPSLPYDLPIVAGRIIGFIPFPIVLGLCAKQTVSFRIWTRVAVFISHDGHHYNMNAPILYIYIYIYIYMCVCQFVQALHKLSPKHPFSGFSIYLTPPPRTICDTKWIFWRVPSRTWIRTQCSAKKLLILHRHSPP